MNKAPNKISPRAINTLTCCDNMSNKESQKVFQAYEFNYKKDVYELKNPELLNESIIKKLNEL